MNILLLLKAEFVKDILYARRYLFEAALRIIMTYITFMGIFFAVRALRIEGDAITIASYQLVGFLLWIVAMSAVGIFSDDIMMGANIGVLEQVCMSPNGLLRYLFCKAISSLLIGTIPILLLLALVLMTTEIKLIFNPFGIFVIFTVTLLGLYGLGLVFGGLALVYKRIGPVSIMVRGAFLFVTGVIIPVEYFPAFVQELLRIAIPMTQGLSLLRMAVVDGMPMLNWLVSTDMVILLMNSATYFFVGLAVFKWLERVSRNRGLLGVY